MRMNLPNQLTLSRLILTALIVIFVNFQFPGVNTLVLVLFAVAGFTDFFDGRIARKNKIITNFGILMDPLADKVLTCSIFIIFVEMQVIPAWMCAIIVARELAITGLRLLAAPKGIVLAADKYGKMKTILQITAIASVFTTRAYPEWGCFGECVFGWHSWAGFLRI